MMIKRVVCRSLKSLLGESLIMKKTKKQIEQAVRSLVEPEIANLGYEIWDIEYYSDGGEWLLEITIENPSGRPISTDDCEKVSRAVGPAIDQADPIENSYCLAVGSPGLGRELKNAFHLGRYMEKEVTVKLFAKNEAVGDKVFHALLKEAGDEKKNFAFELLPGLRPIVLAKKEIAHIFAHDEIYI